MSEQKGNNSFSQRIQLFLRTTWPALIIIALFIYILFFLNNIYKTEENKFWQYSALIIASIAAIFGGISALITNKALELTRTTQRPFLTTVNEPYDPMFRSDHPQNPLKSGPPRIILHIKNTGNLPADKVSIICALSTAKNKDLPKVLEHSKSDPEPPIYFPGVIADHTFYLDTKDFETCKNSGFTIHVNIKYDNKIAAKQGGTIRYFIFEKITEKIQTPIKTTHKNDYWY